MNHKKVDLSYLFFVTYQATIDEFCFFLDSLPEEQFELFSNFYKIKKNSQNTTFILSNEKDNSNTQSATFFPQPPSYNSLSILGHLINNAQWDKIDVLLNKFTHLANVPINQNNHSALGLLLNAKHSFKSVISAILLKHEALFSSTDPDPLLRICNQSPECAHLLPKFLFSKKADLLSLNDYIGKKKQWHPFYNGIKDLNTLKILFDFLVPAHLPKFEQSKSSEHFNALQSNNPENIQNANNVNALNCAFEALCAGCNIHQNVLTNEHLDYITDWVFFSSKSIPVEQQNSWVCTLLDYYKKQETTEQDSPQNSWIFPILQTFEPKVLAQAWAISTINSIHNHYDSNSTQRQLRLLCESGMNVNDNVHAGNFPKPVPLFFFNALLLDANALQIFKNYGCSFCLPRHDNQNIDIVKIIKNLNPELSLGYPADAKEKTLLWLQDNLCQSQISSTNYPIKSNSSPKL